MKFRYSVIIAALIGLAACEKAPLRTESSNNAQINVQLLFEHDGCKIYRFADNGYNLYFTKCDRGQSHVSWNQTMMVGKAVLTRPMEVQTNYDQ
ncbi:MAG: hypothetical protein JWN18_415 [Parcubacteria group bacterium]|nr:hypothetical protein [Parcubacteria group bacterium]